MPTKGKAPVISIVRPPNLQERTKALLEGQTIERVTFSERKLTLHLGSGGEFEFVVEEGFKEIGHG